MQMDFATTLPGLVNLAQLLKLQQLQRSQLISQNISPPPTPATPPPPTPSIMNPYIFAIQQHLLKQRQVQNCSPPASATATLDLARGAEIVRRLDEVKAHNDAFRRRRQAGGAVTKRAKRAGTIKFVKQLNRLMLGKLSQLSNNRLIVNHSDQAKSELQQISLRKAMACAQHQPSEVTSSPMSLSPLRNVSHHDPA